MLPKQHIFVRLYCRGKHSCSDSTAYISNKMYSEAYASAQNSTFYSTDEYSNYHFYGPYSGDNATIICGNDHNCFVYCYNNACNNINLICNGTCNFTVSCGDTVQSDACPNGKILDETENFAFLPKLTLLSFDDIYRNAVTSPCYTPITNAFQCDDYLECSDSTSLHTSDHDIKCANLLYISIWLLQC